MNWLVCACVSMESEDIIPRWFKLTKPIPIRKKIIPVIRSRIQQTKQAQKKTFHPARNVGVAYMIFSKDKWLEWKIEKHRYANLNDRRYAIVRARIFLCRLLLIRNRFEISFMCAVRIWFLLSMQTECNIEPNHNDSTIITHAEKKIEPPKEMGKKWFANET